MKKGTLFGVIALAAIGLILMKFAAITPPAVPLNGTSWILSSLNAQPSLTGTTVTLKIEDGKLSGSDGCNRYGGSLTLNGAQWTLGKDVESTMMACPEPVMQQATAYVAALSQAVSYQSDGQQLTLLDAAGKPLAIFTLQSTAQGGQLPGTSWIATGYNNGNQAVVSIAAGSQLTASFSADGSKIAGSAGCNNYTAAVEISGSSLKIGPAGSTKKMCADPAGVMQQESQYLNALQTAATYRIEANRLELRTASGALAASFEKAP